MKKQALEIFIIKTSYVNYLHSYDSNVMFNDKSGFIRHYVGIILKINDFYYFAPLTHNGRKWKGFDDSIPLNDGWLGAIKLNKMIPIEPFFLNYLAKMINRWEYIHSNDVKVKNYGKLLEKQYRAINMKRYLSIEQIARWVYQSKNINNKSPFYCNFELLEKIANRWCFKFEAIKYLINSYLV